MPGGGPAVLYANVKGCRFPMVSNLFGTIERARFLFRDTLESVRRAIELKIDPAGACERRCATLAAPLTAWRMQPEARAPAGRSSRARRRSANCRSLQCWPRRRRRVHHAAAGLHRGRRPARHGGTRTWACTACSFPAATYEPDREVGLHYQIHRGIGVHHAAAMRRGEPLRVNIFVGGPPAMTLAAVMPLPEGMPELTFAGALARPAHSADPAAAGRSADARRGRFLHHRPRRSAALQKPEGPFGDHLGYYSLAHEFPVLQRRAGLSPPATRSGRSPSSAGRRRRTRRSAQLIHELTGPIIPTVIPGVHAVHAVDAAGVHPLLLAIGSERYVPLRGTPRPQELLTQANAILGQGQLSLAKYLLIVNRDDDRAARHPRHPRVLPRTC